MNITIIWDNPTRSLIDRAEFGKKVSFKRKLGFKPASLSRSVVLTMDDKISMTWKRNLERKVNDQFQTDRKATIYIGSDIIKHSGFVVSARSAKQFSNIVANGILEWRAEAKGANDIDSKYSQNPIRKIFH